MKSDHSSYFLQKAIQKWIKDLKFKILNAENYKKKM